MTDTPQQKAALRINRVARSVRKRFPVGTRVVVGGNVEKGSGVIVRHVPQTNAQGGYLVVQLDTGVTARLSPINIETEGS